MKPTRARYVVHFRLELASTIIALPIVNNCSKRIRNLEKILKTEKMPLKIVPVDLKIYNQIFKELKP